MENIGGDDIQLSSFTSPSSLTIKILKEDFSDSGASVALDSSSFRAARFSGELLLNSSLSITTSNDGGSTTVSSSSNAFKDGYYNISSSVTGETKTIKPKVFEGDISASHYDGTSSSSSVLSYGLTLPATGTGSSFSTTVDASLLNKVTPSIVSKKLAEGLRANSHQ